MQSRLWFKLLARVRGVDRDVQAGVFDFPVGASAWELLTILKSGRVALTRFTVPEGLTVLEMAELAEQELKVRRDSVLLAANDSAEARDWGIETGTFEGFLLPETYQLPADIDGRTLVRTMAEAFQREWDPAWNRRLDSLRMTRVQLVTLASIVEGEARHDEERPIIAGVYANRLRLGMPLQADPTVQYAILLQTGVRKSRLYFRDYNFPSTYNTYLHPGLPPGPVNSPGIRSIEAALYPATVPYLYFVAGPDGYHLFSRTLREHNAAIAKVRKSGGH